MPLIRWYRTQPRCVKSPQRCGDSTLRMKKTRFYWAWEPTSPILTSAGMGIPLRLAGS